MSKYTTVNLSAGDHSPEALVKATKNWRLLRADWCKCSNKDSLENIAYYRDPVSGSHGWMCPECKGIIQTG